LELIWIFFWKPWSFENPPSSLHICVLFMSILKQLLRLHSFYFSLKRNVYFCISYLKMFACGCKVLK
jgi:hypothetical protein